ncbi:MAG: hypothetical protein ACNA8H_16955, partial [Anaerolineales bacterium]
MKAIRITIMVCLSIFAVGCSDESPQHVQSGTGIFISAGEDLWVNVQSNYHRSNDCDKNEVLMESTNSC